ncbi:TPA: acetate kinase, partial [Escherichia coli]|nr:acetate kinase [Escherichia coli]
VLVFTGGIGENSWQIRERICARLAWLGVLLDHRANRAGAAIISKPESKVDVHVVAANEEIVIARSAADMLKTRGV